MIKVVDTCQFLDSPEGKEAEKKEFERFHRYKLWRKPAELESVEENALIVKFKGIGSNKHYEESRDKWVMKSRGVALGNIYFNKYMKVVRREKQDFWAPTCSLAGARIVHSRQTMRRRR